MGGNVRVGLEDSACGSARASSPRSNAEQVTKVAPDHRGARPRDRHARRGARDPRAQGRRQGRLLRAARTMHAHRGPRSTRKTALGEGPLWDVEEQRLYWIDSPTGTTSIRCDRRRARDRSAWDVPEQDRLDGACARRAARSSRSRSGFHFLDFGTGEVDAASTTPSPDKPTNRAQRRQGRPAGPLRRRLDGLSRRRDPIGALYRLDPDLIAAQARRRHHRLERPLLEPGRQDLLLRRHLVRRDLGLRLRHRHRRASPTGATFASSTRRAAAPPTARPSMPRAVCGTRRSMRQARPLSRRTARSTASSTCRSRK